MTMTTETWLTMYVFKHLQAFLEALSNPQATPYLSAHTIAPTRALAEEDFPKML